MEHGAEATLIPAALRAVLYSAIRTAVLQAQRDAGRAVAERDAEAAAAAPFSAAAGLHFHGLHIEERHLCYLLVMTGSSFTCPWLSFPGTSMRRPAAADPLPGRARLWNGSPPPPGESAAARPRRTPAVPVARSMDSRKSVSPGNATPPR